MRASLSRWQIAGFLFTSILGTLLHFLFDLSGQRVIAGLFSAVNESIWEHMKLLFYPMLLFAWLEYVLRKPAPKNYWCIKLRGILLGLLLIPVIYYTYTGIWGKSIDWINIAIFFLASGIAFRWETAWLQKDCSCPLSSGPAMASLALLALLFTVFTFRPPHIPLFQDVPTGTYGFPASP